MFINWITPSWCQCITVRTEKDGTKLTCCSYWRTKTVIIVWWKLSQLWFIFSVARNRKKNKGPKSRFWRNCFQSIVKPNFKKHALFCENNAPLEIRRPFESPSVDFVSWEKTPKCPFDVYADLEAIKVASTQIPRVKSRTREIKRQYEASFGAVLIDSRI